MGIARLNYFLQHACPNGLHPIHFKNLSGKRIAIDISIYLYKFKAMGGIIENMYLLCSIFKFYNITPIFVFDGKPPPEKNRTLEKRKEKKDLAEKKYNELKKRMELSSLSKRDKSTLQLKMKGLEKNFIRLKNWEVRNVKYLLRCMGCAYLEAPGEADKWCAKLVIENKAYACLSDDMDLFVYGCPRVLRYLNIDQHTALEYNLEKILRDLEINESEFRKICVLAGTDYLNKKKWTKTVYYYYKLLLKFKLNNYNDFYKWLELKNILPDPKDELNKTLKLFDVSHIPFTPEMIDRHEPCPHKIKNVAHAIWVYISSGKVIEKTKNIK